MNRTWLVTDGGDNPLDDATPTFLECVDRAGADIVSQPMISNLGGGLYGFTPSAAQAIQGLAFIIDNGASAEPRYVVGTIATQATAQFAAFLLLDELGALWTGDDLQLGLYVDDNSVPLAASLIRVDSYFFLLAPAASDFASKANYRVDPPVGSFLATPRAGSFSLLTATSATIGRTIYDNLTANGSVAALAATRIYPNRRPQNAALPLVVYSVISQVAESSLDGAMETTLKHTRFQFDCYAKTYEQAHELATAVENVIGNLALPDIAGWKVGERDLFENDTSLHRVSSDFMISGG